MINFRRLIPSDMGIGRGERLFLDQGNRETSLRSSWVLSWLL